MSETYRFYKCGCVLWVADNGCRHVAARCSEGETLWNDLRGARDAMNDHEGGQAHGRKTTYLNAFKAAKEEWLEHVGLGQ